MTLAIARTHSRLTRPMRPEEPARIRATIASAPLFTSLSLRAIEDLTQRVAVRCVPANELVVSRDEPGDSMYLIMSGRVKVVIVGESGREVTLSILRRGDTFGEMSLFDGGSRSADCITCESSNLLVLSRADLLEHLENHPQTALNLLGQMARRLRRADESIAQLALCDVNERLVHRLVSLAHEDGTKSSEGFLIEPRPTQQELANMVGSCRETVSRLFNQLVRDGLIIAQGRAMVVTRQLMERERAA